MSSPAPVGDRAAEQSRHGFVATALVRLTSLVAACLGQFDVPGVPDAARHRLDSYRVLWPQKWSFFTSLDQDVLVPYRVGPGADPVPLRPRRLWDEQAAGLVRVGDAWMNETRQLALRVPDRYWQVCPPRDGDACGGLDRSLVLALANPVAHPTLCGVVGLALERVAQAGPAELPRGPRRVLRMAVLDVRCAS